MKRVFFGPTERSGIGQVVRKWATLVNGDFIEFGQVQDQTYDLGIAFVLPVDRIIDIVKEYAKKCTRMVYYTICETEPVNDAYGKLLDLSSVFYTSSDYCAQIFKKQFPATEWRVLKLWAGKAGPSKKFETPWVGKYTFYHIGNIIDPRKNIHRLIEGFIRAQIPDSALVLKATCNDHVKLNIPNVFVLNDFMTEGELEWLHASCDCYVSFSHSEGAGMGAIEAAMRNKPVIIQEHGATKEYVRTEYMVSCRDTPVGVRDFLFEPTHIWGEPSMADLIRHMRSVATGPDYPRDHSYTQLEMSKIKHDIEQL